MKKLISALSLAAVLFGAAHASFAADSCIVSGWPVACAAKATVGEAQSVTLASVSSSSSMQVCFIDSRVFHALASEGVGLDSTKLGMILFLR